MSQLSIEQLVHKGVSTKLHKGETLLLVSSLKKKAKGVEFHESDVLELESETYVRLTDCKFLEKSSGKKEVAEIEVSDTEVFECPAGEECGCLMSQEDAEKSLIECEKKEEVKVEKTVKKKASTKKK